MPCPLTLSLQALSALHRAFEFGGTREKINVLLLMSQYSLELGKWVDVDSANNKLASMLVAEDPL